MKAQLVQRAALPPGSQWAKSTFYFDPTGRLFVVPLNGYDDYVLEIVAMHGAGTENEPVFPYIAPVGDYTVTLNDYYVDYAGSANVAYTLPNVAAGRTFEIMNNGTGNITVDGPSGWLMNGQSVFVIPSGEAYKFISGGNKYRIKY